MNRETPNDVLRKMIFAVANASPEMTDESLEELRTAFRTAFLRQGFSTDDNKECMENIEVGRTVDGTAVHHPIIGYHYPDLDLNVTDILNTAEGSPIPQQLREPSLLDGTVRGWRTGTRSI